MILVIDALRRRQFASDLAAMYYQRKTEFADRSNPATAHQEFDSYDCLPDTMYLLAKDSIHTPLLASIRVLMTTGPHLMRDLYPVSYRAILPFGPHIWEVSRFCTAPGVGGRGKRLGLLWEIICGVMETAMTYGVHQVIFAADQALLPLALECGWVARAIGPTMTHGSHEVTAVVAAITPDGLRNVRDRHNVPG